MPPMALRAELAVCSMASDIWYRVIPAAQVPATSTVPLENVLSKGPNVLDALTSIVDRTCPLNANCAAQKQSMIDFHAKWISPCSDFLQFFGLYDPTHTMNIGDVLGDLL